MKKYSIAASIVGLICTGVSYTAFADTDISSTYCKTGFYAGVQGGRTDTFYKSAPLLAPAASYSIASAQLLTNESLYQLSQSGYNGGLLNQQVDDIGMGGRVFAGYQFTPYFATELGYTQYAKTSYSGRTQNLVSTQATGTGDDQITSTQTIYASYDGEVAEHAIDLVAKGTLPLQGGFGLYLKAGMAMIAADQSINGTIHQTQTIQNAANVTTGQYTAANNAGTVYSKTYQAFRPTYGAGIDYTIPHTSMDIDVSWTRVQGTGAIPNADLAAVGIAYKFA